MDRQEYQRGFAYAARDRPSGHHRAFAEWKVRTSKFEFIRDFWSGYLGWCSTRLDAKKPPDPKAGGLVLGTDLDR
jgi:hypothetical protein